ncbi:vWA domain-containing protein [Candidatus Nitrosotenuis uzonensis]|uniref:von Willebrand factor type A domain protein n=1 Tax=Candidatus Nitrosotenuis uzonensis TaxID=1407055 RepID=V6AU08_9ARCH|nr:vWA domain-containing protein [Candidatus Nitrosotenuis uzonensis]CDI06201.1 putative von Willebrand factor type A domain protein [Candidatus Nitrosotenuis uzonensis]
MQSLRLGYDTLVEIATFLARRWSEREKVVVEFSDKKETQTKIKDSKISLVSPERYIGDDFERYRQFRVSIWYEAMRVKFCKKILSNDHAFGFILNTLETRRIELLGRKIWRGMDEEIIFGYTYQWIYRPQLANVLGKTRIVEAFYQHFLFGDVKGEIQPSHAEKITRASARAKEIVGEALEKKHDTEWLEKKVPEILSILDIDALVTIPLSVPWKAPGLAVTKQDLVKAVNKIAENREADFGKVDVKNVLEGKAVAEEFKVLREETRKSQNKGLGSEAIGIHVPGSTNVDETRIYDQDLISNLKTKFKEWKTSWKEQHVINGDEFDEESYVEGHYKPFLTDIKKSINAKIVILLDHSSSINDVQTQYKKATLALCEVLSFLKIRFSVYAFNTSQKQVVCWLIKSEDAKWNSATAKRLAQIEANGGTPLADVYQKMYPILRSKKPDIFLTLSDGEPSDPDAVRAMVKSLRSVGIKMVAIGIGHDTFSATKIASNLRYLDYERTLAVSRLKDIPNRVLSVLQAS